MALSLLAASGTSGDRPALIGPSATLSYRDLLVRVEVTASWLVAAGVSAGPVAIVATNELDTAVMVHTLIALGWPALLLHPRFTSAERNGLVERGQATLVVEPGWARQAAKIPRRAVSACRADGRTALAVLGTSGSSGAPRLAILSRDAFSASARATWHHLGFGPDERWLLALSIAHIGGLSILTRSLCARTTAVLVPPGETQQLVDVLERQEITLLSLVPAQLGRLLEAWPRREPPSRLRAVLVGGDGVSAELLERGREWPLLSTYGLTETCSQITCQAPDTAPGIEHGSGIPLLGTQVDIVAGRIRVRGPTLFSGYLGESGSPCGPEGWFETGDLGAFDGAGRLHVLGRCSELIITGGQNVHPREVEAVLEGVPGVAEACVFGVPDPTWGQLVAAALVLDGEPPNDARLKQALVCALAPFKHPRLLTTAETFEFGPGGKRDRAKTAAKLSARLRRMAR